MNAPIQERAERTEPTFGAAATAPFADTTRDLSAFSQVTGELTSEASDELQNAQKQGLGADAVEAARKNLAEALNNAALAAKALEAAYAAQAAHLQGTSAFLNNKPEQGRPFFDIAGEKIGQARTFFVGALDKVATSPFLTRVFDRIHSRLESADDRITATAVKADEALTRGVGSFLATMRRTADTMGRMVTTIKETPGRLIDAAKATGRDLSDTTAYYVAQTQHQLVKFGQDVKSDVVTMVDATRDAAVKAGTKVVDGVTLAAAAGVAVGTAARDQAIIAHESVKQTVRDTRDVGEAVVRTGASASVDAAKATVNLGAQVVSGLRSRFSDNLARVQAQRAAEANANAAASPTTPKSGM